MSDEGARRGDEYVRAVWMKVSGEPRHAWPDSAWRQETSRKDLYRIYRTGGL